MKTRRQIINAGLAAAAGASISCTHAADNGEWKSLFDGKTLDGWNKTPRIGVGGSLSKAHTPEAVEAAIEKTLSWHRSQDSGAHRHVGYWNVVSGAIEGGQNPPGSDEHHQLEQLSSTLRGLLSLDDVDK